MSKERLPFSVRFLYLVLVPVSLSQTGPLSFCAPSEVSSLLSRLTYLLCASSEVSPLIIFLFLPLAVHFEAKTHWLGRRSELPNPTPTDEGLLMS